ncbi:MAG TPA: GNAT family N-acetyltransferase [Chthonomonadaceae bacterium]|nr:GNAT family N-acetyltransferase [Chthonomonadaceae bacterium]
MAAYATIPIAFTVRSRYRVEAIDGGLGGLALVEEAVTPYEKDYDAMPGEGPLTWSARWDLSSWGILGAFEDGGRVGGAAVAWQTPGLTDIGCQRATAVLWDLRVRPDYRGRGVGSLLFSEAIAWAKDRGAVMLEVETQNNNVPACRFYARQGCKLGAIHCHAYDPELEEVQLLWYRPI